MPSLTGIGFLRAMIPVLTLWAQSDAFDGASLPRVLFDGAYVVDHYALVLKGLVSILLIGFILTRVDAPELGRVLGDTSLPLLLLACVLNHFDRALQAGAFNTATPTVVPKALVIPEHNTSVESRTEFKRNTRVPEGGFSLGEDGFEAYHFEVMSTGSAPRNAVSTHRQWFYIVGPDA